MCTNKISKKNILSLTAIIVMIAALMPTPVNAEATVTTYTVPVTYQLEQNVTIDGTAPVNASFTLLYPNPEDVYLQYDFSNITDTTYGIDIKVLDTNDTVIKTISLAAGDSLSAIVPLTGVPTEFIVQVTNTTNLASSTWTGRITVIVYDTAQFTVSGLPSTITLKSGEDYSFTLTVKQTKGPAGSLNWVATFTDEHGRVANGKITTSFTPTYQSTTGYGWQGTESVKIHANSWTSGTYRGTIKAYFTSSVRTPTGAPVVDNAEVINIMFDPVTVTMVGGGLLGGSLLGYGLGFWGVAIAATIFFVAVYFVFIRK